MARKYTDRQLARLAKHRYFLIQFLTKPPRRSHVGFPKWISRHAVLRYSLAELLSNVLPWGFIWPRSANGRKV